MKINIIGTIVGMTMFFNSYAQENIGFNKGSKFVEGSLHLNLTKETGESNSRVNFTTNIGYFLTNKIAVGSTVSVVDYHHLIDENPEVHAFTAGLFGRYYFLNLGKRFKTYAVVSANHERIRVSSLNGNVEVEEPLYKGFRLSGGFGANFFISPNISFSLSLNDLLTYHTSKMEVEEPSRETYFSLDLNRFYNELSASTFGLTFKF